MKKNKRKKTTKSQKKNVALLVLLVFVLLAIVLVFVGRPVFRKMEVSSYPTDYEEDVEKWAKEYGVDKFLVYAVIKTESGFSPKADSSAGARGLMQMTEETFFWLTDKIAKNEDLTFQSLYTPEISIRFGVYFLSLCLEKYGNDISTAAAAYHSGWGTVNKLLADEENTENGIHLIRFPFNQMNHYVNKINNNYNKYLELYE